MEIKMGITVQIAGQTFRAVFKKYVNPNTGAELMLL